MAHTWNLVLTRQYLANMTRHWEVWKGQTLREICGVFFNSFNPQNIAWWYAPVNGEGHDRFLSCYIKLVSLCILSRATTFFIVNVFQIFTFRITGFLVKRILSSCHQLDFCIIVLHLFQFVLRLKIISSCHPLILNSSKRIPPTQA